MSLDPAEQWDIAVIGGGAAGLFAALTAAELGSSVLILEKNRRPGVKILMSGGTRCNLTNARGLRRGGVVTGPIDPDFPIDRLQGVRAIQEAFSPAAGRFIGPSLKTFDVDSTVRWFESHGVATKVEANGKIFPASDRAVDVLNVLLRRLEHRLAAAVTAARRLLHGRRLRLAGVDQGHRDCPMPPRR